MEDNKQCHQNIECDVDSCEYNNCEHHHCDLDGIKVSCNCDKNSATKSETVCDSFKEKEEKGN